jgi:deoxyribodipyrimidine photo-lyase
MSNKSPSALVWFREDLRLADNPALAAAVATGLPLLCVYLFDDRSPGFRTTGGATRWRLDLSLAALEAGLAQRGGELHVLRGAAEDLLPGLVEAAGARRLFWNRRYGGPEREVDGRLKSLFREKGLQVESFNGGLLVEPWDIAPKAGGYFKVFTPFWRAARQKIGETPPLAAPDRLLAAPWPKGLPALCREGLALAPRRPDWARLFPDPDAGEAGARKRLAAFLADRLADYGTRRDQLAADGTSGLSAHLHFGEISPRQIFAALHDRSSDKYLSEIGRREFSAHLLYARPDLPWNNFNPRFDAFPYRADPGSLKAWRRGRTGYPVVDAAMRQVWRTGFMHNRARMVVASFLTKHLLIDWREGESWFWDTLADADAANNAASWQWVAGCGADAAPYFRIFNPVRQGETFDSDGAYVRAFCPELARLPARFLHRPWTAPRATLDEAGVTIGKNWPAPIVDHDFARKRALDAFAAISR